MVLGLFGSLLRHGGVERVNRLAGAVLAEMAQDNGEPYRLLSLNEARGSFSFVVDGREYSGTGWGRSKARFVAHALGLARGARIAYLGHPYFAPIGFLLRVANPRLRYWVGTHGVEVWRPLSPLCRSALRRADGVTAPSRFTLDHLIRTQGLDGEKVALVPHGLDPAFADLESDDDPSSASESGQILTVGRLLIIEPGKGVDTVIRALPTVLQAAPHAFFVVVGDGDQRPFLEGLADDLGVRHKVLFVGHVGERELKDYYKKATVVVMPSRQEGFGLVFLEAMAFGKPVIGGDVGGTPDVIVDGETGFLVKYGDVDTLAERLIRLLNDRDLCKRMGAAGRQRLKENYTFECFRKRLSGLLGDAQLPSR